MIANDQHLVRRKVETAMPGSMSRRPHHDKFTVADADGITIVERMIRRYRRVEGAEITPRRWLSIRRVGQWHALAAEERSGFRQGGRRLHTPDASHFQRMEVDLGAGEFFVGAR